MQVFQPDQITNLLHHWRIRCHRDRYNSSTEEWHSGCEEILPEIEGFCHLVQAIVTADHELYFLVLLTQVVRTTLLRFKQHCCTYSLGPNYCGR